MAREGEVIVMRIGIQIAIIAAIYVILVLWNVHAVTNGTGDKKAAAKEIIKTFTQLCVSAIAIVLVFNFVLMLNQVPSESMEMTVMTDDIIISTRYDADEIERYDVMVFTPPDHPNLYFIKRVIGLPGETITVENGSVYADGVKLDDSFVNGEMDSSGDGIYVVPEGCYFMMGDNRNYSNDSRFWETKYVPIENFVAKAKIVLFPLNRIGLIE